MTDDSNSFTPAEAVRSIEAYEVPRPETPVDVHLDGNEGPLPPREFVERLEPPTREAIRNYPDYEPLKRAIAERHDLPEDRILVTAGADESILRICRVALEPGRSMVLSRPTFSMLPRFGALVGAELRPVDWRRGSYPVEDVLAAVDETTGLVVAVSPNNPNGLTGTVEEFEAVADALSETLLLVDHAYVEFCEEDATELALERDDVVVTRTLSKAWGMAGLRVGYAVADPAIVEWLDRAGNPYPISSASIAIATRRLEGEADALDGYVGRVASERDRLEGILEEYDVATTDSGANFVFGEFGDATWMQEALAGMGFAVRAFPDEPGLEDALRITCPGDELVADRLVHALRTILDPDALFLDLDGVLADVSDSYRQAIVVTAEAFGLSITDDDVSRAKSAGDANNDWILTHRMLRDAGIDADFDEVKQAYEARYQGEGEHRGLWREESMIYTVERVLELSERLPIGIVTGRPRRDAERFFEHTGLGEVVEAVVCMEDAERKPSPEPVQLLAERMGVDRGWMIGDTPDDARAARHADALPLGMIAPGERAETMRPALIEAGCARILDDFEELERLLPR